jgi:hypothetical protein
LRAHCEREGRDYATIEKTAQVGLTIEPDRGERVASASAAVDRLGQLAELGIDHAIFPLPPANPAAFAALATQVVPEAKKMAVAGR